MVREEAASVAEIQGLRGIIMSLTPGGSSKVSKELMFLGTEPLSLHKKQKDDPVTLILLGINKKKKKNFF